MGGWLKKGPSITFAWCILWFPRYNIVGFDEFCMHSEEGMFLHKEGRVMAHSAVGENQMVPFPIQACD